MYRKQNLDMTRYRGLSTDPKPDADFGSTFHEMDTGDIYRFDGSEWQKCGSLAGTDPSIYMSMWGAKGNTKKAWALSALASGHSDTGIFKTVTGNPISISDALAAKIQSLSVSLSPIQTGSGDPSPDNVRPISGRQSVTVMRTGENLFPYKDVETQTKNGVTITIEKSNGAITNIHMQGTATSAFSFAFSSATDIWTLFKGAYKMYIGGDKPTMSKTFDINIRKSGESHDISTGSNVLTISLTEDTDFGSAYIWVYSGAVLNHNIVPVIVRSGIDTSVKYPITQRQSMNIALGQTVYGGTVDVTTGVMTVTRGEIASYAGETLPGEWISDRDVYAAGTTPTIGAQVVYELADSFTIDLTPAQLSTLKGDNNVWSDGDSVTMTYKAVAE